MPILGLVRFLTTLLSLAILAVAGYLLWSWYQGVWVTDASGDLVRLRDQWRLAAGAGLLAWSFIGRGVLLLLIARRDERRSRPERGEGRVLASPTGNALYVETHGRPGAPTLVLTHGWSMDSTIWNYAKADLGGAFRLVLWDLPGLGRSKASKGGIALEAFARDLAAVLDEAGPGRPMLVGHSIGGMTIQTLLRDRPDLAGRIGGVVLLNTTYTNPVRTMILSGLLRALQKPVIEPVMKLMIALAPLVWLSKWQSYLSGSAHLGGRLAFGKFVTRSQLDHTVLLATRNSPAVEMKGDLAMLNWDATSALEGVRTPVLVIGGDKDIVTKLEAGRRIAGDAGGRLEVVADVNHMGPLERADLYHRLIADFALSVQPSAASDLAGSRQPFGGSDAPASAPDLSRPPNLH